MSLYVLIVIANWSSGAGAVPIPGQYTWDQCQQAGSIAMSDDYQRYAAKGFLCVPAPPPKDTP